MVLTTQGGSMARKLVPSLAVVAIGLLTFVAVNPADAAPSREAAQSGPYLVDGVRTLEDRNRVAATGAVIDSIESGVADISAIPDEVRQLRRLGYRVTRRRR